MKINFKKIEINPKFVENAVIVAKAALSVTIIGVVTTVAVIGAVIVVAAIDGAIQQKIDPVGFQKAWDEEQKEMEL